jgi:hypothetical protein
VLGLADVCTSTQGRTDIFAINGINGDERSLYVRCTLPSHLIGEYEVPTDLLEGANGAPVTQYRIIHRKDPGPETLIPLTHF